MRWGKVFTTYVPVLLSLILALFPFYWMLITSLKDNQELYDVSNNPFVVLHPVLEHYVFLFKETAMATWMVNSLVVAIASCSISLVCSILGGYALARLRFPGASSLGWLIFITYLVPPTLLFLPLTELINRFRLVDNLWSLILTYPTFLIPFGTWLLIGYFKGIPRELEESAMIDGASRIVAMLRIVVPLALPGILSVGIFAFTLSWNEFIYALVFLSDAAHKTVPVGVSSELIRGDVFFWGELMAGALLGSVPVAIIYSFFVDYFVAGLTAGAVKG